MMKYLYKTLALVLLGAAACACASLSSLQPAVAGVEPEYDDALYASFDRLAERHEQRLLQEEADRLTEKSRLSTRTLLAVDQATGDTLHLNLNLFDNDFMYGWQYNGFQRYGIPYRYGFPYRHGLYDPYYAFNAYGPYYDFGYGPWMSPWYSGWSHAHWYTMHSLYGIYDPWYDPWYGPYGPYGGYGFGFGYYGHSFGIYDPWYGGWYDPWYSGWYGGWYDPWYWYDSWYGHGWYGPIYSNRRPGQVWARRGDVAPEPRPGVVSPTRRVTTKSSLTTAGRVPVAGTRPSVSGVQQKVSSAVRTAGVRTSVATPSRSTSVARPASGTVNSKVMTTNSRVVRSSNQNSYDNYNSYNNQVNRSQSASPVRQSISTGSSSSSGGGFSGGSSRTTSTSTSSHSSGMGGRR